MNGQLALQKTLSEMFAAAKQRNPAFSLRAFARRLELSPASLSEILNGKRRVSRKLAERILKNLALPPKEMNHILDLFPEIANRTVSLAPPKPPTGTVSARVELESVVLAIDPERLSEARKLLDELRERAGGLVSRIENPNDYRLSIELRPPLG